MTGSERADAIRVDLQVIAGMITPGARLLDVGCGDGTLLRYLADHVGVDGRGIEISRTGVNACVREGLSVVQGNADTDLKDYPDNAFDFVVLSQTLQATYNPLVVMRQLLRIGRRAIVSFPNFGYWRCRWQLLTRGRMPVTATLDNPWFATPNIHFCTIRDFLELCKAENIVVEKRYALTHNGTGQRLSGFGPMANLLAAQGVFMLRRGADSVAG